MSLPKIQIPIFNITIPSSGKMIKMKCLVGRELKLLLIAKESKDQNQYFITISQILNNCLVDDINIESLFWYDIEYIFTKLIVTSKGEKNQKVSYICQLNDCNTTNNVVINIDDATVPKVDKNELIINTKAEDNTPVALKFLYPTLKDMENINADDFASARSSIELLYDLLYSVSTGEGVFIKNKNFDRDEAKEVVDSLNENQLSELFDFVGNMPTLSLDTKFTCTKCNHEHQLPLRGMDDFF